MAIPKIIADLTLQLASKMSEGDTTATLQSNVDDDGVTLPDGQYYFTIDGANSYKEHISCTKTGTALSAIKSVSRQGLETSGCVREHRIGASVVMTDFATYKNYMDQVAIQGVADATSTSKGVVKLSCNSANDPLAVGNDDPRLPSADPTTLFMLQANMTGAILPYAGRTAPSGWLLCNGAAVSRTTYASLFSIIAPAKEVAISIASPAVFTATSHGLVAGDVVSLTTTGGLPSGLSTNTDYYVLADGLTADAFKLAFSIGGAAINTSGTQSGTHTFHATAWGKGDGLTTFNVPDYRSKTLVGMGSASSITLKFEAGARSSNVITVPGSFPYQGQAVTLSSTGTLPGGLAAATTYYVYRASATTISFCASAADAAAGTVITLSDGGTGVHTISHALTAETIMGQMGGEKAHGLSISELASHTHTVNAVGTSTVSFSSQSGTTYVATATTSAAGGNTAHNTMMPYALTNFIIKY